MCWILIHGPPSADEERGSGSVRSSGPSSCGYIAEQDARVACECRALQHHLHMVAAPWLRRIAPRWRCTWGETTLWLGIPLPSQWMDQFVLCTTRCAGDSCRLDGNSTETGKRYIPSSEPTDGQWLVAEAVDVAVGVDFGTPLQRAELIAHLHCRLNTVVECFPQGLDSIIWYFTQAYLWLGEQ